MTALPWFRFYTAALHDPKVQRLAPAVFKGWVNMLCLAAEHGGVLPSIEDAAFALRLSNRQAGDLLGELSAAGLLDTEEGVSSPHNWKQRQHQGDVSTSRVKRFRERRVKRDETVSETPPDTEQSRAERDDATASSATREASDERSHANGLEQGHRDTSEKAGTRGTRCPADWRPNTANSQRCAQLGLDVEATIIEFRNYWRAIPGSKGLKLDWEGTFYNRCSEVAGRRNGMASQGRRASGYQPASITEAARDIDRAIDERGF